MADLPPSSLAKVPGEHLLHPASNETPVTAEYLPFPHNSQELIEFKPGKSLHFPVGHPTQFVLSVLTYLPAEQLEHNEPVIVLC